MHKVIIPVDYSETSLNAARFSAQMLAGKNDIQVIIYNNYETDNDLDVCLIFQEILKQEFAKAGVKDIICVNEMGGDLIENISRLAHTLRATMVVMGITGKSAIRQIMVGSNTLKLIDKNLYPVMIIPPDATYNGVNHVAFASDYKNVENTTPAPLINAVLQLFNPALHIVHISKEKQQSLSPEMEKEKEKLRQMFKEFDTNFYFLQHSDFFEAIDTFIREKNINILVTVPKHQSNSTSLFKSTHTKRLAYHSHIPILAAHE